MTIFSATLLGFVASITVVLEGIAFLEQLGYEAFNRSRFLVVLY
jgi:hypothetical protein